MCELPPSPLSQYYKVMLHESISSLPHGFQPLLPCRSSETNDILVTRCDMICAPVAFEKVTQTCIKILSLVDLLSD